MKKIPKHRDNIELLYSKERWKNVTYAHYFFSLIHREFEKKGKKSSEWHHYISSKMLTAEQLLEYARQE